VFGLARDARPPQRIGTISLSAQAVSRISRPWSPEVRSAETQSRFRAAVTRSFQTRDADMALARMVGELADL